MYIEFHEIEESKLISYYYFVAQVSNHDFKELNGFKIRNILSVVFNTKIRDLILDDLFNKNGNLLTIETRENLFRYLSSDEIDDLKYLLSNYLDYQIESPWYEHINNVLNETSLNTIVVSSSILNSSILNELKLIYPKKKFSDWRSINDTTSALFLDYNHSWKKRNIFNIEKNNSIGIFLGHFFENVFKRKIYNDASDTYNVLNSPFRKKLFGSDIIAEIKNKLDSLKPSESFNEWDLLHESDDRNYNNPQEELIIHYSINKSNKFRATASFLLFKEEKYFIATAKDLVTNSSIFENKSQFSHLESIIDDLDLNQLNKAIQKDESINLIIKPLWKKFNLSEKDGRLWKQLLKKKIQENDLLNVYSVIENISGIKNFISLNTFENTYCNPYSDTVIPREKKVFKAICKYLELPHEYRIAIHRERILIGGHSQELHVKLKPVIDAIVAFGILDCYKSDDKLLNVLNEVIDKIEEKVDMDYFGFTRDSLIYYCIELCYEIIDKMRMRPVLKIEYITPN